MTVMQQPGELPIQRAKPSTGDFKRCFGQCVIVILASEEGTTPLKIELDDPDAKPIVCEPVDGEAPVPRPMQIYDGEPVVKRAIDTALACCARHVIVLTSESLYERVASIADAAGVGRAEISVVTRDFHRETELTSEASGFEAFGMPMGLLMAVRGAVRKAASDYGMLLVMQCDQVRMTPEHLFELCSDAVDHLEADIVTSWISFFPRFPLVLSRRFIDDLECQAHLVTDCPGGKRPLSRLNVHDHLFGEEKLAANPVLPTAVEGYLEALDDHEEGDGQEEPASVSVDDEELLWADAFGRRCRLDFPLLNKKRFKEALVYLDNAATTQRCARALQAMRDYDEYANANIYRGTYELSCSSTTAYDDARRCIERFIGAKENSIVFTANTTASINLVAQAWAMGKLRKDDIIAIALSSHHSLIIPFLIAAEKTGACIEYLPYDDCGRLDREAYSAIMRKGPRLVCIPHISNVLGIIEPVRDLADEAHMVGARVLVDAAQSLPHVPLGVEELGADWVAFSGHKAYGPMGIGCLWVSDEAGQEMVPLQGGGGTVAHVSKGSFYLRSKPIQFELGTPAVSQSVGLAAALEYLDALGMENVLRHEAALTRYLVSGLEKLDGVVIVGDHSGKDGLAGLVCFTVPGADSMDIVGFLGKLGIAARGGGHCALPLHASLGLSGTVRISMGVYTTKSDIDAVINAMCTYLELLSRANSN